MSSVPVLVVDIFAVFKLYFSYKKMPGFLIFRSSVLIWLASFEGAYWRLFWKRLSSFACRFLRVNLLFFAERRLSFLTFLAFSDVVDFGRRRSLRCRSLFVSVSSTFSKRSAGSGIS